jgi:IS5 family transposase
MQRVVTDDLKLVLTILRFSKWLKRHGFRSDSFKYNDLWKMFTEKGSDIKRDKENTIV